MKKMLICLIKAYQKHSKHRMPCCRFLPTCSEYAIEAIEKYGALRGGMKAFWRVLRCNPWNAHTGVDLP